MDQQPDTVAGAVEVPVVAAGPLEHVAAHGVDVAGGDAGADGCEPGELCLEHQVVDLAAARRDGSPTTKLRVMSEW